MGGWLVWRRPTLPTGERGWKILLLYRNNLVVFPYFKGAGTPPTQIISFGCCGALTWPLFLRWTLNTTIKEADLPRMAGRK